MKAKCRLVRQIVGPPPDTDWTAPWHEILHRWNQRVQVFVIKSGIRTWSEQCVFQYWSFSAYVHSLPDSRYIKRVLNWKPRGKGQAGMQRYTWTSKLEAYSRFTSVPLDAWSPQFFEDHEHDFDAFCRRGLPHYVSSVQ